MKKKKGSSIVLILIAVVIIAIIVSAALVFKWYKDSISKPLASDNSIVSFEIQQGTTSIQTGDILFEKGLIKTKIVWQIYIKLNKPVILADKYRIPKNLSLIEIVGILEEGQEDEVIWITIPEGVTLTQIIDIFDKNYKCTEECKFDLDEFKSIVNQPDPYIFIKADDPNQRQFGPNVISFLQEYKPKGVDLEGFLYPETYAFDLDSSSLSIVERLVNELSDQTDKLNLENGKRSFYETLILASIVERESLNETDRPNIASVFSNRLDINMALQSDATINYVTGKKETRPSNADLQVNSPYNTYKYPGLPPTPISNARLHSIELSLTPPDTDYLFFIHDEDGVAHFGKTVEEHNKNICKYLDKSC